METTTVYAAKPYDITVGRGILSQLGGKLKQLFPRGRTVVITDDNVEAIYGNVLRKSLDRAEIVHSFFIADHGEGVKSLETFGEVMTYLQQCKLTKTDFLIALGGGTVGDLTGFAASCYLRGIPFVQVPTTLLAAVDASVGGKTALNLPTAKNQIGSFYQPALVWCDYATLKTMDPLLYFDGIAEAIKMAVIGDTKLFDFLATANIFDETEKIITACVALKADIVAADETDTGQRQVLNLGHTLGHAIEARSRYTVTHGQAVAIGMVKISEIGASHGFTQYDCGERIAELLQRFHLPTVCPYPLKELLPYILHDKKRLEDDISFIIPETVGCCRKVKVPFKKLPEFLGLRED